MTRAEFSAVIAFIELACGKSLEPQRLDVVWEMLCDLPADTLKIAAKRVMAEHRWATFPSIAEIREAAMLTQRGEVTALSPAEAWELAWRAVRNIDPEIPRSIERAMTPLPPLVRESVQ